MAFVVVTHVNLFKYDASLYAGRDSELNPKLSDQSG